MSPPDHGPLCLPEQAEFKGTLHKIWSRGSLLGREVGPGGPQFAQARVRALPPPKKQQQKKQETHEARKDVFVIRF